MALDKEEWVKMMKNRRIAAFGIGHELIRDILKLPDGSRITAIVDDFDRMCLKFSVDATEGTESWYMFPEHKEFELIEMKYVECEDMRYIAVVFKWWFWLRLTSLWNKTKEKIKTWVDKEE